LSAVEEVTLHQPVYLAVTMIPAVGAADEHLINGVTRHSVVKESNDRQFAKVVENRDLGNDFHKLTFQVTESSYLRSAESGDEVKIYPMNSSNDVMVALSGLGLVGPATQQLFYFTRNPLFRADQEIPEPPFPTPLSYFDALSYYLAITETVTYEAVQQLSLICPESDDLRSLASSFEAYRKRMEDLKAAGASITWKNILFEFPQLLGKITPTNYFSLVPSIKPRYYSIASLPVPATSDAPLKFELVISQLKYKDVIVHT